MKRSFGALVALLALVGSSPARGAWEFRDFVNADGDTASGIVQPALNAAGIGLVIGCQGDRWRQLAIIPMPPDPLILSPSGLIRIGFGGQRSPKTRWRVRNLGEGRAYFAPAPSALVRQFIDEERKSHNAIFEAQLQPEGEQPIVLRFNLGGLRAAIRTNLWERCKLETYLGDPKDLDVGTPSPTPKNTPKATPTRSKN